jgi:hypothetical protein
MLRVAEANAVSFLPPPTIDVQQLLLFLQLSLIPEASALATATSMSEHCAGVGTGKTIVNNFIRPAVARSSLLFNVQIEPVLSVVAALVQSASREMFLNDFTIDAM